MNRTFEGPVSEIHGFALEVVETSPVYRLQLWGRRWIARASLDCECTDVWKRLHNHRDGYVRDLKTQLSHSRDTGAIPILVRRLVRVTHVTSRKKSTTVCEFELTESPQVRHAAN